MDVLLIGAGVIGTVYGTQLAAAGHSITVPAHGSRTADVARLGLVARDVTNGTTRTAPVHVVGDASGERYDLVLVSVWADQIRLTTDALRSLSGAPVVLFFGNNPGGRAALPTDLPGTVHLAFPASVGQCATEPPSTSASPSRRPPSRPAVADPSRSSSRRCPATASR